MGMRLYTFNSDPDTGMSVGSIHFNKSSGDMLVYDGADWVPLVCRDVHETTDKCNWCGSGGVFINRGRCDNCGGVT